MPDSGADQAFYGTVFARVFEVWVHLWPLARHNSRAPRESGLALTRLICAACLERLDYNDPIYNVYTDVLCGRRALDMHRLEH